MPTPGNKRGRSSLFPGSSSWPERVFELETYGRLSHESTAPVWAIETEQVGWNAASACFGAALAWQAIWGFTSLCLVLVDKPVPLVRYLVDGSYWAYLVHIPPAIVLPALLADLPWHASVKFFVVVTGTFFICFGSYELFVRSSIIGEVLNGQRWPRALRAALTNRPLPGTVQT